VKYRADIDGLRAIAVLAVVAGHAGALSGGFVGVDVFFVISGYLITGILLGEMERGEYSLIRFYERRIRRLFPALFVMIAIVAAAAYLLFLPEDLVTFGQSAIATAFYVSNILFWSQANYFDVTADQKPLLHTWSLAVEEQFYVLFPLFMAMCFFLGGKRRGLLQIGVTFALLASFALSVWGVAHKPTAAFYWLPYRAWELMCGAVLSVGLAPRALPAWGRQAAAALGLAGIVASATLLTRTTPFPGLAAAPACVGAALLLYTGEHETWVRRLLSWRPLVFVGMISYSLYLWHWPALLFARYVVITPLDAWQAAAAIAVAFVLAIASWRWLERPFRIRPAPGTARRAYLGAAAAMAATAALGALIWHYDDVPWRVSPAVQSLAQARLSADPMQMQCHLVFERRAEAPCQRGAAGARPTVLLVGDSHADAIAQAFFETAAAHGVSGVQITDAGWAPVLGFQKQDERAKSDYNIAMTTRTLAAHPEIRTIALVIDWDREAQQFHYVDGRGRDVGRAQAISDGLAALIDKYPDRRFFLFAPTPQAPDFGGHPAARALLYHRAFAPAQSRANFEAEQVAPVRAIIARLAALPNVTIEDPTPYLCDTSSCPGIADGQLLYRDGDHLSLTGARRLAPLYASELR
jgi:peptidoglycan/LPS O-acetylase OafA/YrhL